MSSDTFDSTTFDITAIDPFDPAFRADPYPVYRRLREVAPIYQSPIEPDVFILTRFADCEAVLRDTRWSSNPVHRPQVKREQATDVRTATSQTDLHVLLFMDPPDHTRLRRLVSKAFTPRRVEALRPRIGEIVDEVLDRAADEGGLDIVADLGYTVPITVICEMMGVPVADRDLFAPWSSAASRLLDGDISHDELTAGLAGVMAIINYFNDLFEERRRAPGDDLVSALLAAEEEGDRLTESELRMMTLLTFIAGHETTTNLIGNGMKALLEHRDQFDRLVAEPDLIASTVDECLRWDGAAHLTGRVATTEIEVGGRTFAAGDQVVTLLAAANRDPERFDRPETFDIGRSDPHHLAFSHGIHHCLGASLARAEGQVAIGSLVRRFPNMELRTTTPEYREHFVLRGLRELQVAV